jgi:hypothetical protein
MRDRGGGLFHWRTGLGVLLVGGGEVQRGHWCWWVSAGLGAGGRWRGAVGV